MGDGKNGKKKILEYGLHTAVFLGLVWAGFKYVNGEEVVLALRNFRYALMPLMLTLTVIYLLLKTWRFRLMVTPFAPHLRRATVYKAYVSGQAMTLLPGGIAGRAGLLKQVGVPVSHSSVPVAVQSMLDQAVFLAGALVVALWFETARGPVLVALAGVGAVALLVVIPYTRQRVAGFFDRVAARFNYQKGWRQFLAALPAIFTRPIMIRSLILTLVAFVVNIVILDLTLRGLNLTATYPMLFLAYILPTMLGRLLPVPGGIGPTEATMVGFLTAVAGLETNITVAAVAIFRIVAIVVPIIIGAIVYFVSWRGSNEPIAEASPQQLEVSRARESDL
jgi:uncharacterized protein (TIRG00374 family)